MTDIVEQLRSLPSASAVPLGWNEFLQRQVLRRARVRARAARRLQAALVTVGVAVLGALGIWSQQRASPPLVAQRSVTRAAPLEYRLAPVARDESGARTAASERWLAALPPEPIIVRVGTHTAVTNLEDRIAWVDDTLTLIDAEGGGGARALQLERDRLINSLAQVRYAETLAADLP